MILHTLPKRTFPNVAKERRFCYNRSTIGITEKAKVHFINSCPPCIPNLQEYYCLSDIPRVKDYANRLSYNIVECEYGILLFSEKSHLSVLKDYLHLDYYVTHITEEQLTLYRQQSNGLNLDAIVVHNSYSDIQTQTSYFLYYAL